ncbi:MAG TPA: hypothetical protein VF510_10425 [Ktedonobacterales bacterium]
MSQILLPPPNAGTEESSPPASNALVTSPPAPPAYLYEPEPPKRQSRFWRMIKWPLRQIIKGIYLTGVFAKRHRVVAVIVLAAVLVLAASGFVAYRVVQQQEIAQEQNSLTTSINLVSSPQAGALPLSVLHVLHARKTYNAQEEWDNLSPSLRAQYQQQGGSVSSLQQSFDQARANGLTLDRFVYSGGFTNPSTGVSHYTIEVYAHEGSAQGLLTWFFLVDANGYISSINDLTPSQQ